MKQQARDLSRWEQIKVFQNQTIKSLEKAAQHLVDVLSEMKKNRRAIVNLKSRVEILEDRAGIKREVRERK